MLKACKKAKTIGRDPIPNYIDHIYHNMSKQMTSALKKATKLVSRKNTKHIKKDKMQKKIHDCNKAVKCSEDTDNQEHLHTLKIKCDEFEDEPLEMSDTSDSESSNDDDIDVMQGWIIKGQGLQFI